jgi:uncharacterized protein DUF3574
MNKKIIIPVCFVVLLTAAFFEFKESGDAYIKTELYFGMSIPGGGSVSPDEWQAFEDTVITKILNNGSTVYDARGKWRNESGQIITENTKVVMALNVMTPDVSAKLDDIRERYKKYYRQESVMRIDSKVEAGF